MENPLLVFVSSAIEEFRSERKAIRNTISSIEVARPWVFEFTPASSQRADAAYLRKVEECDIFVLLLGSELRQAVREEYELATKLAKPVLAFLKETERSPEAEGFARSIQTIWKGFRDARSLCVEVKEAVEDELIRGYRRGIKVVTSQARVDSSLVSPERLQAGGPAGEYRVIPPTPVVRVGASFFPGTVNTQEIVQFYAGGYVTKVDMDISGNVTHIGFYRDGLPTNVIFDPESRTITFWKGPVWQGAALEIPFDGPSEKGKWWLRLPSRVVSQTNGMEYSMGQQKAFLSQEFVCEGGYRVVVFMNPLEPEEQSVELYLFRGRRQVQPSVDWDTKRISFPRD